MDLDNRSERRSVHTRNSYSCKVIMNVNLINQSKTNTADSTNSIYFKKDQQDIESLNTSQNIPQSSKHIKNYSYDINTNPAEDLHSKIDKIFGDKNNLSKMPTKTSKRNTFSQSFVEANKPNSEAFNTDDELYKSSSTIKFNTPGNFQQFQNSAMNQRNRCLNDLGAHSSRNNVNSPLNASLIASFQNQTNETPNFKNGKSKHLTFGQQTSPANQLEQHTDETVTIEQMILPSEKEIKYSRQRNVTKSENLISISNGNNLYQKYEIDKFSTVDPETIKIETKRIIKNFNFLFSDANSSFTDTNSPYLNTFGHDQIKKLKFDTIAEVPSALNSISDNRNGDNTKRSHIVNEISRLNLNSASPNYTESKFTSMKKDKKRSSSSLSN